MKNKRATWDSGTLEEMVHKPVPKPNPLQGWASRIEGIARIPIKGGRELNNLKRTLNLQACQTN